MLTKALAAVCAICLVILTVIAYQGYKEKQATRAALAAAAAYEAHRDTMYRVDIARLILKTPADTDAFLRTRFEQGIIRARALEELWDRHHAVPEWRTALDNLEAARRAMDPEKMTEEAFSRFQKR